MMSVNIVEPFFYCLLASMIWAPIVFFAASHFAKDEANGLDDKIWPAAMLIAALPALAAPFAAAFGLSLRNPAPLPPMADATASVTYAPVIVTAAEPVVRSTISLAEMLEAAALIYFYGFILFLILGAFRMAHFSYRVRYAFDLDEPKLEAGLEEWRHRMGIKRAPRYAFTDAISSVCVHGIFRPVVLMPHSLLDKVSTEDAILMGAHEMAHIKRGDTALFALCTGVKAIFWFNPFMQRIAACANLAAEQAADALVLSRGVSRRKYAQCFVEGLRFAAGQREDARFTSKALVPAFTPFDKKSRRARLDAILSGTGGDSFLTLPNKLGLLLSSIAAAAFALTQAALAVAPGPAEEMLSATPVEGPITLNFNEKYSLKDEEKKAHSGVDIKAKRGTVVRAAGDGVITDATSRYQGKTAWGNVVVIDHGHGLITRYAHLDSYKVRKGDKVKAGDTIGAVGSTGRTTGPHLHFEVLQDGLAIDPSPLIAAKPLPAPQPIAAPELRKAEIAPAPRYRIVETKILGEQPEPPETVLPVTPAPAAPPPSLNEKIELQLAGRLEEIDEQMQLAFEDFEPFENMEEFEAFTEEISEKFEDMEFAFSGMDDITIKVHELSGEHADGYVFAMADDLEDIREVQLEAMEDAKEAMREAKEARESARLEIERSKDERQRVLESAARERQQAREEAKREAAARKRERKQAERERKREAKERQRERAEQQRERAEHQREMERERAEQRAEYARERAERDIERALERAERQAERELERAERAWEAREANASISEAELLALRESAVKEAQQDLNKELAEIQRLRAELERNQKN